MYLLKLSLRPMRAAPASQLFSALAVGLLLFLVGFLQWMQQSLGPVTARLQNEQVITAYLDPGLDPKDEGRIVDAIRSQLGARPVEVSLTQSAQFVEQIRGEYPELAQELESLGAEMLGMVPRFVTVSGLMDAATLGQIKSVPGVESAESSHDRYQHIVSAFRAVRWIARLFIVGLAAVLFTGMIHLARMNAGLHGDALSLLRLFGAGAMQLRLPGLLSGLYVGLLGGLLAAAGWALGGNWMGAQLIALSPLFQGMSGPSLVFALVLLGAGGITGLLAGVLGNVATDR